MTKHPNAPAVDKTKRAKQSPITLEEYDKIHELWESGMRKCEIAIELDRTSGAIVHAITRLTREVVERRENNRLRVKKTRYKYDHVPIEEKDLSSLPDDQLFEHSKEYLL